MPPVDPVGGMKAIAVIAGIAKSVAETPGGAAARAELGQTALTLAKALNVALFPLAAMNYGYDKARTYFQEKFAEDITAKAASIPPDQIVEPKASIAGPALQGLAFSHEEPELKDLYLNLLASAMDGRDPQKVHPGYTEIIRQLDATEARLLNDIFTSGGKVPLVAIKIESTLTSTLSESLLKPVANFIDLDTKEPHEEPRFAAMADNWVRLGLVTVEYGQFTGGAELWAWAETRPEMARLRAAHPGRRVFAERGVLKVSAFGRSFAAAVGIAVP